ncbi:hypothetical protein D7X94_00500 [Acutalibacter sp. 1XD8-33]|uniref:aldolase catalytic domain-containing protein n=1 Tax=Acutalibacter sp. 1XD8-33 TaxID=2320081 RepID=UPI000EA270FB|nr:aldolase catalytic domain-containing protein [Acutalibacter sp. 1XD8-33]RKJ41993.1 hypothetical protein D7X94_00500 [Acutalibacter sp. 1XD8-33]
MTKQRDKISLLDCTLRDGAYITESKFGSAAIKGIIEKCQSAGVEIIECGWLKNDDYRPGTTFYHVPSDLEPYLSGKSRNTVYVVMIDWDRYELDYLPPYDGKSIDAIRVVFPHGKHRQAVEVGRQIKEKGYQIYFQAANTLAYSDEELTELAGEMNRLGIQGLSIVDTFGAMYPEDLERIVHVLNENLDRKVKLGFHSHNNQQLSFALTMNFIQLLWEEEREVIVDASLCGMGRGAGNATTELVVSYLNRKCGCHYDMDSIMDAIDIYMEYFTENYHWGYSTPYFIAGLYCCHVNNIAYLLKNHRTNAKDMRNIIESLPAEDRKKYDYDLLEKKYLQNQELYVDDQAALENLSACLKGRELLLICPGKSSLEEQQTIQRYIQENRPNVLGVNAILQGYNYDYLFFVSSARYEYAKATYQRSFEKAERIILSSVKNVPEGNERIVGYHHVVKRGWDYYDNAAICALRLADLLGIEKVTIAGFDSFMMKYNESYADPFLPTHSSEDWKAINAEIADMFSDFRKNAVHCREITFLTPSAFGP